MCDARHAYPACATHGRPPDHDRERRTGTEAQSDGSRTGRVTMLARLIGTVALTGALPASFIGPAGADVSTTQHLPTAACNSGTLNAHESVPETTGNGTPISAHDAIPGDENVTPCG